jgi:hypothetical protein
VIDMDDKTIKRMMKRVQKIYGKSKYKHSNEHHFYLDCEGCLIEVEEVMKTIYEMGQEELIKDMMNKHKPPSHMGILPEEITIKTERMFSFAQTLAEHMLEAEKIKIEKQYKKLNNKKKFRKDSI